MPEIDFVINNNFILVMSFQSVFVSQAGAFGSHMNTRFVLSIALTSYSINQIMSQYIFFAFRSLLAICHLLTGTNELMKTSAEEGRRGFSILEGCNILDQRV